jgi:hypothetical protein
MNADAPAVTVLVPTFNRRRYLGGALASILAQTYTDFEAIVVNDGGEPVDDVVHALDDPRLVFIDRRENRGKAASLNEALARARGRYVAYLDDDDHYYPHHLERLVGALEAHPECGAAYSDLYKVHCRVEPDGTRRVLGKVVNISRDFDRFFLCYFNHVLHVSLMHRRDLLEKTGPYNESLGVLIDWDMTRRLGFFTDFHHVGEVTGEFFGPVGRCDRISYRQRQDRVKYLGQVLTIRTTRPPKPWPKMPDLSVVVLAESLDSAVAETLRRIWTWTFMPYEVVLPLPAAELARLKTTMPNIRPVPVPEGARRGSCLRAALGAARGDHVAVVPRGAAVGNLWIENALHAAVTGAAGGAAFLGTGEKEALRPVLARPEDWQAVCAAPEEMPLADALRTRGMEVREPRPTETAFQFDQLLQDAQSLEAEGSWAQAAWLYGQIGARFSNARWMRERRAGALYRAGGRDGEALSAVRELNARRPTVSTLVLEARLLRRAGDEASAAELLEQAEEALSVKD